MSEEGDYPTEGRSEPKEAFRPSILEAAEYHSMQNRVREIVERNFSARLCLDLLWALVETSRKRTLTDGENEVLLSTCDALQKSLVLQPECRSLTDRSYEELASGVEGQRTERSPTDEELRLELRRICEVLGLN